MSCTALDTSTHDSTPSSDRAGVDCCMEPWELVQSLCPDPTLKTIMPAHTLLPGQRSSSSWAQTIASVTHPLLPPRRAGDEAAKEKQPAATSALVCVARSSPSNMDELLRGVNLVERKLKQCYNTVQWNPFPVDFWLSHEPHLCEKRMMTVMANSSVVSDYFTSVLQSASAMFKQKAYLHWYERYQCSAEMIEESLEAVRSTAELYSRLQ